MNFAPLLPEVRAELGLSNTWAGMLTSATILTHTVLQLPSGHVNDSLGPRRSVAFGLTLQALAVVGAGLAPSFEVLLLCRLLAGVGTAVAFVAGLAYANRLVASEQRVLSQSVYGAATSLGVLVILLFSERLSLWGGWRATMVAEGLLVLLAGWLIASRLHGGRGHNSAPALPWVATLREPALHLLGIAHAITYGTFMGVTTWVVTFLWESHGVGLDWAGPLSTVLTIAAIGGRFFGGLYMAGRERQMIVFSCALTAVATITLPLLPGVLLALLALLVLGWFVSAPFGTVFAYPSLLSGRTSSGRELSLINFIANVGALAFPPLLGYALDQTGSFVVAFACVGAVGAVGSVVVGLWLPRVGAGGPTLHGPGESAGTPEAGSQPNSA